MGTRYRFTLAVALVFLCLSPTGVLSQESDPAVRVFPLKAEMTGQFTGGLQRLSPSVDPSVVWKPGLLAIGIGAELIIGFSQFDMYALPYLRAEIGWFHADFGYVLPLVRPLAGDGLTGLSAGFAIAPKPFEVGYGRFGFELGLDFNIAGFAEEYGLLAGASTAERILVPAVLSGRFGFGVTYSFALL